MVAFFFLLAHDCLNLEPLANLKTVWQFIQDIQKEDATRHRYRHDVCEKRISQTQRKSCRHQRPGFGHAEMLAHFYGHKHCAAYPNCSITATQPGNWNIVGLLFSKIRIYGCSPGTKAYFGWEVIADDTAACATERALPRPKPCIVQCDNKIPLLRAYNYIPACEHCAPFCYMVLQGSPWCNPCKKKIKSCLSGNKHWNVGNVLDEISTSAALEAAKCMSRRKQCCLIGCVGKHKLELSFQHTNTSTWGDYRYMKQSGKLTWGTWGTAPVLVEKPSVVGACLVEIYRAI